ncbi:carboxymuconolactone decarboxylase family protein [soil metagenome]
MANIPYADLGDPAIKPLVDRIVAERGSVLHLYQMLLHSPPVAEGWLALLTAIRHNCSLSPALRELVIMRVAAVNGASYEAAQHAPIALREGVTQQQLDDLPDWKSSSSFTPIQRAVLELTDTMTTTVQVQPATLAALKPFLNERELVELVATIASYNMVSRFLEALAIHATDPR